mmetsp:Transcript_33830/g.67010  ORF Transcript_33830/g.67010 Transcript_33830/m.67010 type:complete len:82 (-) Transcript_33830:801-1046(-)
MPTAQTGLLSMQEKPLECQVQNERELAVLLIRSLSLLVNSINSESYPVSPRTEEADFSISRGKFLPSYRGRKARGGLGFVQ